MITICFTYFRSLALANLAAALYSLRRQDLANVEAIVVLDNNTDDLMPSMQAIVDGLAFPIPVHLMSHKHGDHAKTHSWSTNTVLREAVAPWVFFSRADYILDFDAVKRFSDVVRSKSGDWDGFVTGNVYHLNADVGVCEMTRWREAGPRELLSLPGAEASYTVIDAGVWMARKATFDRVGGLDEGLTAWGHAQTHFQHKLFKAGVEFVRIPEPMFYHPQHSAPRDLDLAHRQLGERGISLHDLWSRHEGARIY